VDARERIYCLLNLEEADRVGYVDFFWSETIDRWKKEGLPEHADLKEYFKMDIAFIGADITPKFDTITVEETEKHKIFRDAFGVKVKSWKHRSGVPYALEPAVFTLEEFKERIEPLLDPEYPARISSSKYPFKADVEKAVKKLQEKYFVFSSILGPFEYARHILGERVDRILVLMHKDPRLVEYVFEVLGRFLGTVAKAFIDYGVDGVWVWDDVAYRSGPFFSPKMYEKYVMKAHAKITQPYRAKNLPAVLHTDGNVNVLIPYFLKAGFTALQPLEAKAGMNVVELKEKYGDRMAFIGNIDVRELSKTKEDIKREVLSKIPKAMEGGGYIACSDHSVPPTVSLDNYTFFLNVVRKYGRYAKTAK